MEVFYHAGAIISVFLGVLILFNKSKQTHTWLLGTWLIILGINIFLLHRIADHEENHNLLLIINWALLIIQVPLPYVFVVLLQRQKLCNPKLLIIHFVPFFVFLLIVIINPKIISNSVSHDIFISNNIFESFMIIYAVIGIAVYLSIVWISLFKLKKSVKQYYSNQDIGNIKWVQLFIIGLSLSWLSFVLFTIIHNVLAVLPPDTPINYSIIILSGSVILLGISGLHNTDFFIPKLDNETPKKHIIEDADKDLLISELTRLEKEMHENKYYLQPRLSIKELSRNTGIPINNISRAVNTLKSQNFYEFVNQYRLEEFIKRVETEDTYEYTYEAIAYECGFNSRSTFYDLFKKRMGETPGQFIKKMRSNFAKNN
jgi:AraC-like DNA-binding protein